MQQGQGSKPHAAILASPGMGHLIPVLELGHRLSGLDMDVTVFVVATDVTSSESQLKKSMQRAPNLKTIMLPPVDISGAVTETPMSIVSQLALLMRESLASLRSAISAMGHHRPAALIVDLFGTEAFKIADEFGMLKYQYVTSNAWFLAVTAYLAVADKEAIHEHAVLKKPLLVPGCISLRFDDTFDVFSNKREDHLANAELRRMGIETATADGILVNTWQDLERTTLQALSSEKKLGPVVNVPVYSIGPLVRVAELDRSGSNESEVVAWLEKQARESVIYVSFGSGGTLLAEQMVELAWGLELSKQRFVWVVRPPMDDPMGSFYDLGKTQDKTPKYLPDGFLTRTRERGLVVPTWAPQADVLAHRAVGGFLTHCGWNSSLESITNGVPMIAWPLYAEQKMNATMLTEEMGVAIRPEMAGRVVGREEIAEMVRAVMEGEKGKEMRKRAEELKHDAEKASGKGGSSYDSMLEVTKQCEARQILIMKLNAQGAYGA